MKKYWILVCAMVLTVCVMTGCRNGSSGETSVPTTQTTPSTTQRTQPTTRATVPSTTDNFMTDASESIDDIIGSGDTTAPSDTAGAGRNSARMLG